MKLRPAISRSSLSALYLFLSSSSFMLISCNSSTESEEPAASMETRIVYQKNISGDSHYYTVNLNGESETLLDIADYGRSLLLYSWLSINPIKEKVIYYDENARNITIRNYDGSGSVTVNLDGNEGPFTDATLQFAPNGEWALCFAGGAAYKVNMSGKGVPLSDGSSTKQLAKTWPNNLDYISFSEDGGLYTFGVLYVTVMKSDGSVLKSYKNYNADYPKLTPAGDKVFFLNNEEGGQKTFNYIDLTTDEFTGIAFSVSEYSISPDGNYVVYNKYRADNVYDLWLYDVKNGFSQRMTEDQNMNRTPLFITNDKIVWQSDYSIMSIINVDGTGRRVFLEGGTIIGSERFPIK